MVCLQKRWFFFFSRSLHSHHLTLRALHPCGRELMDFTPKKTSSLLLVYWENLKSYFQREEIKPSRFLFLLDCQKTLRYTKLRPFLTTFIQSSMFSLFFSFRILKKKKFRRKYDLSYAPRGFIQQVFNRLLGVTNNHVAMWESGMLCGLREHRCVFFYITPLPSYLLSQYWASFVGWVGWREVLPWLDGCVDGLNNGPFPSHCYFNNRSIVPWSL